MPGDLPGGIVERAARVKLVLYDVDGVLTDGGLYFLGEAGVAVRFSARDGLGMTIAREAGLLQGIVTRRAMPAVRRRAEELRLDEIHLGALEKADTVREILARRGLVGEQCCFVGDDIVDLPALALVGLPVAVADAAEPVRRAAAYVTRAVGGHGAVREVIELILGAWGQPFALPQSGGPP
ncbi:MAG: HAD hydrolase family protein [Acidobacteria bacterium]|nr:HAD hydrolase family protein [Acidobacteriota bacterium]